MNFSKINELKPYDLNCNIFDVYSYDGLSMQELLCQFFTKINECINTSNETIDLAEWLVNEGLKQEVAIKLTKWLNDGTLENLINETLFENLNKKIDNVTSQLEEIEKPKTINLGSVYKNYKEDASPIIRQLIEEGYNTIYLPRKVTLNTTLNLTNLDCINIIGCGRNEKGENATIIYCNTGGSAIDLVGSQNIKLSSFIMVNEDLTNPSTVGILQGRSVENKWAQFNVIEHIKLRFSHMPQANNGKGTIGLYNFKSELNTINNVYFFADNPCVFTVSNIFNVKSSFVKHDGEATIKSTSFIGITCLVSRYSHALILDGVSDMSFSNLYLQRYRAYPVETNSEDYAILVTAPEKTRGVDGDEQYIDYQVNNITIHTFDNEFYPGFIKIQAKCSNFMLKGQHTHGSGHIIHIDPNSSTKQCSLTNSYININKSTPVDSQYLLYSDGSNYGFNSNIIYLSSSSYRCFSDTPCYGNIFLNSNDEKLSELNSSSKNLGIGSTGDIYIGNRVIGYTWGNPTRTDLKTGSILFNSYMDTGQPHSYIYTDTGWVNTGQIGYRKSDVATITSTYVPKYVGEEVLAWDTKTWYKAVGTSPGEFKAMS